MVSRSAPVPKAKRSVIKIPYRHGSIDVSKASGELFRDTREVTYKLRKVCADAAQGRAALLSLTRWLSGVWNVELFDSSIGDYYIDARCVSITPDTDEVCPTVVVVIEADPYTKGGNL